MSSFPKGKVILITGGASGIGQATALAFAREGTSVVIGDLDGAAAEKTVADIKQKGGEASFVRMDVTQSADVQRLVAKAVDQYGGLDYAFNNAGTVGSAAGIVDTTEEDWNSVVALNLTSVWLCMKYEIPELLKRGGGAIVNNGSTISLVGAAGFAAAVAAKHGVAGVTKSAALQYAKQRIRVNALATGAVRTPLSQRMMEQYPGYETAILTNIPQGRWCEPEEIAETVLFLCSDRATHITGHILAVDGGLTTY